MANYYGSDADDVGKNFDNFYGGDGVDLAVGTASSNEIYGGAQDDELLPSQPDRATGSGTAADPFRPVDFGPSGDDIADGGSGTDLVVGGDGNDRLYGGEGSDSGSFAGPSFGLFVIAGVYGGDGKDYADGGGGKDDVYGGAGDDILLGGPGGDLIQGDAGKDNLYGGPDADRFRFLSLHDLNGDRIGDFDSKEKDVIDISAIDARRGGKDNAFTYIGDHDFTGKGQVAFRDGKLMLNTDNDHQAEAVIFVNAHTLSKSDFDL